MANPEPRSPLADVPIFAGLGDATLRGLETQTRVRQYPAGQILCSEGDPGEDLLLLEAGTVRVSRFSAGGQEVVLAEVAAPVAFGELALIDREPRSATLTATSDVRIRYLGRHAVFDLLSREPAVAIAMLRRLAAMVRATNERFSDLVVLDVPGRLAKWLLEHADTGGVARIGHSQEELAHMLGTSRETLNRTLRRLARLGLVDIAGREVAIRDRAGLQAMVTP